MKKRFLYSIPLLALALASCGNKDSGTSNQTGTTMTEISTDGTTNSTDDIDVTNTVTFLNKATKMTEELDYLPSGDDLTKSKAETATLNSQMLNSDGTADDEFGNYYKDITKQDLTEGGTKRIGTDYDCLYGFATKQVNFLVSNILSCRDIVVEKVTQLDTWVKDDGTYLYLSYDINSDTVSFKRLCPYFPYQEGVLTYNDKNELCLDFTIYELYRSYTVNYVENEYLYCEVYTNGDKEAYYDLTSDTVDFYVFRYISTEKVRGNPLWSAHIVEKDGYYISSENAYGNMQITLFDIKTEYKIVRASSISIEVGLYAFDMQKAVSYRDGSFKIKFDNMYLSDINGFVNNLYYGLNVGKEGDHANIDLYPIGIDYSNIAGVITAFNDGVGSSTYAMDMIQCLTDNYDYYINPIYKGIPMKEMTFDYFGDPINPTDEVMNSLVPKDYINVNEQKVDTTPYKMVEIAAEGTFSNYDIEKINISVSVTNEENLSTLYSYQYVIALKNNDELINVAIKPVGHKGDTIATTFTKEDINTATFDIIYSKLKEYITAKDIVAILFGGEGNIDVDQYKNYVYGDKEDFTKDDILAQSNLMYGYGLYTMLKQFGFDLYTASPEEIQ